MLPKDDCSWKQKNLREITESLQIRHTYINIYIYEVDMKVNIYEDIHMRARASA